jgi:DNA modification methylase
MTWQVIEGDCLDVLPTLADGSIDAVVCDPPYGLSREPDVAEVLRHWLAGDDYQHRGGGFMGNSWDSFVPGPAVWRQALRVLKPGGYLLAFGGSRTYDLLAIALRLAGFELRDSILWLYAQGFPKSHNIAKAIDSLPWRHPGDFKLREAAAWREYGTALKPGHEPIAVARKPLDGTILANAREHGTGALHIDGCRIGTSKDIPASPSNTDSDLVYGAYGTGDGRVGSGFDANIGRWPANVALSHTPDCRIVGRRSIASDGHFPAARGPSGFGANDGSNAGGLHGHEGLDERHTRGEVVDEWDCAPGCPVALLDEQTGDRPAGGDVLTSRQSFVTGYMGGSAASPPHFGYRDSGGGSRFFYCAKASRVERNAGLHGFSEQALNWSSGDANPGSFQSAGTNRSAKNAHPTVKPIELMRWLVRLVTPPGGTVLDTHNGSGTTGCAAVLEGFNYVGIEKHDTPERPFVSVSRARIAYWSDPVKADAAIAAMLRELEAEAEPSDDAGPVQLGLGV